MSFVIRVVVILWPAKIEDEIIQGASDLLHMTELDELVARWGGEGGGEEQKLTGSICRT